MKVQTEKIANLCRLCAKPAKNFKTGQEKLIFKKEFLFFAMNIEAVDSHAGQTGSKMWPRNVNERARLFSPGRLETRNKFAQYYAGYPSLSAFLSSLDAVGA